MGKKKKRGNSKYITTCTELKHFAKQVQSGEFNDEKFHKAFDFFKTPAYGKKGVHNNGN